MSWLFSRALVEAFSAATSSDGEPSAQLNVMLTPQQFWRNDKMMDCSKPSLFGLTSRPLTESRGEALLTWYREVSLARTSAPRERAPASPENEAGSGARCAGLFAKFDPAESTWKTVQSSLLADSELFSETWPRSGMTRDGMSYLRPTVARPIYASASGLWPTPTVDGNYNRKGASPASGDGLATAVRLWPTPTASLGSNGGRITPSKSREGGTLIEAVSARTWPTPCASASKGSSPASLVRKSGASRANDRIDHAVMASDGGQLNPEWVEWLMAFPIGWTELKPLEMRKFQEWRQQHGASLLAPTE